MGVLMSTQEVTERMRVLLDAAEARFTGRLSAEQYGQIMRLNAVDAPALPVVTSGHLAYGPWDMSDGSPATTNDPSRIKVDANTGIHYIE